MSEAELSWEKRYVSLRESHVLLQKQNERQAAVITKLNEDLRNCDQALEINKRSLHTMMTESNKKEQEFIEVINRLKEKVRELSNGDISQLGNERNLRP